MTPPNLHVAQHEAARLDGVQHLGGGRDVAAGEDVAADPRIGGGGLGVLADGVDQGHGVWLQKCPHLVEVAPEVTPPDMLEHADGHDAIVLPPVVAVVLQPKLDAIRQAPPRRFRGGGVALLLGEGEAHHLDAGVLGEVHGDAAPAAADVQHALPRREAELAPDVCALGCLGGLQGRLRFAVVRAGVVHVAVQEGAEQRLIQVVVVAHVGEAGAGVVPRREQGGDGRQEPLGPTPGLPAFQVDAQDGQQVDELAFGHLPVAGHVGLAERQAGVQGDGRQRRGAPQRPGGAGLAGAERVPRAIRQLHGERAVADMAGQALEEHRRQA